MSEEQKKHRPVAEIQAEYQNLCTKAGHLQYQIVTLKKDLEILNGTLRDLNVEAAASHQAAAEAAEKAKTESSEEKKSNE